MTVEQVRSAPLAYLATPYTHYKGGIEQAFIDASKLAARLFEAGIKIYSPIAHCHPIAIHGGLDPLNATMWIAFDEAIMSVSNVLIVAMMDGWDKSRGVLHEIEFFHARNKVVFGCNPETLGMWRADPRELIGACKARMVVA